VPALALLVAVSFAPRPASADDWKGKPDGAEVHLGAMGGLAIVNFNAGFALLGNASKKIIEHGFVGEVTDSVSLETELGPVFVASSTIFSYSLHLRWDFEYNEHWTFFALGGAGGYVTGSNFGNTWELFPRFGLGAFYRVNDLVMVRAEASHEVIAVGVTVPFYL
jgi:hypothetical protein